MSKSDELAERIRASAGDAAPEYGLILGSGLGHLSGSIEEGVAIPYSDLPGFPHAGVSGHVPKLVIGDLEGKRVAVFGGRSHYYESGRADAMRLPLETLAALGTKKLILTNAAGAVNAALAPGDYTLRLVGTGNGNAWDVLIDDVRLEQVGAAASAVPEPASWALMVCGFMGAGAVLRRARPGLRLAA